MTATKANITALTTAQLNEVMLELQGKAIPTIQKELDYALGSYTRLVGHGYWAGAFDAYVDAARILAKAAGIEVKLK